MPGMSSRVLIIGTGGTLGMRPREPDLVLEPDEFGQAFSEHVPELRDIAEFDTRVLFHLDSTDVGPEQWVIIANVIARSIDSYDGIVVTHGTDAMAYTATALSFLLRALPKPVILTGSQRPLADARTDGRANLVGAVDLATRDLPEVCVYFDGVLLRGNRATKRSSFAFGAFHSPNHLPLAEVGTAVRTVSEPLRSTDAFRVEGGFDTRVAAVRLVPGQTPAVLRALVGIGLRGVLIEAFGVGNVPVVDRSVGEAIRDLHDSGVVVALGSQAPHGRVDLAMYAGGRWARECGAVGIGDMTLEAAAVKMMYLLGTSGSVEETRRRFLGPIAGELTPVD
jgi:L-asparaginase